MIKISCFERLYLLLHADSRGKIRQDWQVFSEEEPSKCYDRPSLFALSSIFVSSRVGIVADVNDAYDSPELCLTSKEFAAMTKCV